MLRLWLSLRFVSWGLGQWLVLLIKVSRHRKSDVSKATPERKGGKNPKPRKDAGHPNHTPMLPAARHHAIIMRSGESVKSVQQRRALSGPRGGLGCPIKRLD